MNPQHAFTIYNAAAGAGKTYTVVKAYLIKLLTGEFQESYKNVLAITFTNKAVAEMKSRVLESLVGINNATPSFKYQQLINDIISETGIDKKLLKQKADRILKSILHNYAGFDIVTIDTFTHRVIRTFAKDLEIPMNFEIEMDTDSLIEEGVDALIAKVGLNEELTKTLIDFALSKLEDDKSWDITIELNKIAKLLFSENDRIYLDKLLDKSIHNFTELKTVLTAKIKADQKKIVAIAEGIIQSIQVAGLVFEDFTRKSIPSHFVKLKNLEFKGVFKSVWSQNIETASFYNKTLDVVKKEAIDSLRPLIEKAFLETKERALQLKLYENIIKNIIPLSVLNAIDKEIRNIKKERNILLISEFNKIISDAIKDQPAPFIYERLGERYRDYFIDEFQDTSELQWQNMIPLIDNAIATETLAGKRGQLTIVGDAKQAIYRWRGGKAEQFINLSLDENPFSVKEKRVRNLPRNYRSCKGIIKFNNDLFTFLSNDFSNELYQKLYLLGNNQEYNDKEGGYVNVSFVEAKNVEEENEVYPDKVYETIIALTKKGYELSQICVLTRRQKEGTAIADVLVEKGIPIISSETLLLKNDPRVCFIIDLLTWYVNPDDLLAKIAVLHFMTERFSIDEKHSFLQKMVSIDKSSFITELTLYGVDFNFYQLDVKPCYDGIEYIINSFDLTATAPAYLQFFLDTVFSYTQKFGEGLIGFLTYWERKKDTLSIIAPAGEEAVMMMTIHKAKGLEFPCVIYPYANVDIYKELEPKTWLPVAKEDFEGFEDVFINYNKELSELGPEALRIVNHRQSQLELDNLNILYVALTRAEEQLYIISKVELNAKGESNFNKFSGKFINYLKHIGIWNNDQLSYDFGIATKPEQIKTAVKSSTESIVLTKFDNALKKHKVHIITNAGKLWDTAQATAIEKGNLIHDLMASIYVYKDIDDVIIRAQESGMITVSEKDTLYKELKMVLDHPELAPFFSEDKEVLNERDIMAQGHMYRPDRIIIDTEKKATIIDYKTGEHKTVYTNQLLLYGELLENMGYHIDRKILVYFNDELTLKYL
ncbi:UvrD-helicase domain-containing protein [Aquimarina addita]|uniref:DNA 3'-5' helicase n=1 Tax=Aquimarina addita TaxID=870485 RepID=A0ABP6UTX8_9FLAO